MDCAVDIAFLFCSPETSILLECCSTFDALCNRAGGSGDDGLEKECGASERRVSRDGGAPTASSLSPAFPATVTHPPIWSFELPCCRATGRDNERAWTFSRSLRRRCQLGPPVPRPLCPSVSRSIRNWIKLTWDLTISDLSSSLTRIIFIDTCSMSGNRGILIRG